MGHRERRIYVRGSGGGSGDGEEDVIEFDPGRKRMTPDEERAYQVRYVPCGRCDGTGWVRTNAPVMGDDGIIRRIPRRREKCPQCNGTGKLLDQFGTFGE